MAKESKVHSLPELDIEKATPRSVMTGKPLTAATDHQATTAARRSSKSTPPMTPLPTPPPPSLAHLQPAPAARHSTVVIDKTLASASNLMKLLPSGTLLAFQALSPSFTNNGVCVLANKYLTFVLIMICTVSSVFFSFTDSFRGRDGKVYYGIATTKGFLVFNYEEKEDDEARNWRLRDLTQLRIRWVDYVHALFSGLVLHAVVLTDTNVQECFFKDAGPNNHALLVNLPLGIGFFASIVFLIFPTSRKGIGYSDSTR